MRGSATSTFVAKGDRAVGAAVIDENELAQERRTAEHTALLVVHRPRFSRSFSTGNDDGDVAAGLGTVLDRRRPRQALGRGTRHSSLFPIFTVGVMNT